jgi:putative Holliday junction resolvase
MDAMAGNVVTIEELAAQLPRGRRLMGLDVGTKTIGLALSDVTRVVASPLDTIRRQRFTADALRLLQVVGEQEVCGLVIGLPLNMDGSEGPRAQSTRSFARNLARIEAFPEGLPIAFWDERLTTAAAERTLLEADMSRKRRSEVIDKMAAALILQGALDRIGRLAGVHGPTASPY